MQFVRNCWYAAGYSRDVGDDLVAATILGENLVLYRRADGAVTALADRCPHRFLPLSLGRRIGDDIQCGYHGIRFDCHGVCLKVPGQNSVPTNLSVRSYPTVERHGVLWVWMGDPALADEARLFDLPEFTSSDFALHLGEPLHLASNYLNVAENLCDPSHVAFVHPTTLGNPASEDVPIEAHREDGKVVTYRWVKDSPPIGVFQELADFTGNVDRWHYYHLYVPNVAVIDFGSAAVEDRITYERRGEAAQIYAIHLLTPVDATHTVDRWLHLRNFALDDPEIGERMNRLFQVAFGEDKRILEAIQAEELKLDGQKPQMIAADKGANLYRRMVERMLKAEAVAV